MPEGSDIFAAAQYLKELLLQQTTTTTDSADSDAAAATTAAATAAAVYVHYSPSNMIPLDSIASFGKKLWIHLKNNQTIEIHLGLHGSLELSKLEPSSEIVIPTRIPRYRIYFELLEQKKILMLTLSDLSFGGHIEMNSTGFFCGNSSSSLVDPLYLETEAELVEQLFQLRNQNGRTILVNAITDQKKRFVGIGNFLAAEILYDARLNPRKKVSSLTNDDLVRLASAMIRLMKLHANKRLEALRIRNRLDDSETREGIIYHQESDPEGNEVIADETVRSNRIFYWCPNVQV
jgi:formamidopyrimidine-DNA glycosylase